MELGDIIKGYREKYKMTMQEFADAAGLSKGYISMLEKNHHPQSKRRLSPSLGTYKKVAAAMRITLDELIAMMDDNATVRMAEEEPSYYLDPETARLADEMKNNPGRRVLMSAAEDLTPEETIEVIDFINSLKKGDPTP